MTRHSGIALGLALLGAAIGFVAACNFGAVLDPVFSQLHASGTFNKPFKAVIRQQPDPANNITGLLELSLDSGECSLNSLSTAVAGNSSPALGLLPTPTSIQLPSNTAVGRVQTFTGTSELARVTLNGFEFSLQTNTSFAVSRVNGTLPTGSPCADLPVEQRVSPASTIPIVELDAAVLANLRGVASRWLAAFPNSLISATLLQAPGQLILRAGKATTTSSLAPPQAMETKPGVYPVSLVGLLLEVPGSQLPAPGGTAAKEPQMALLVPAQTYVAPINMQAGSLTVALNSSITLSILAWLQPSSTPLPAPGTPLPRFGPGLEEAVRDLLNNPYQALYVQPLVNSSAGCVNSSSSSSGEGGGSSLPAGAAQGGSEGVGGTRCDPVTQTSSAQQQQQAAQPGQQACGCKPGWTGLGCSICSTDSGDDACAALMSPNVSGSGDKCVASLNYGPNTAYKTMSCEVQDRLRAYIQSTEVYCSTDGSNPRFQYFNDSSSRGQASSRRPLDEAGRSGAAHSAGDKLHALAVNSYVYLAQALCDVFGRQEEVFVKEFITTCQEEGPDSIELWKDTTNFGGMAIMVLYQHSADLHETLKDAARASSRANAASRRPAMEVSVPLPASDILSLLNRFLSEFLAARVAVDLAATMYEVGEKMAEIFLTGLSTMYVSLYQAVVKLMGLMPDWRRRPAVLRPGLRVAIAGALAHNTVSSVLPYLEGIPAMAQRLPEMEAKVSYISTYVTHLWSLVLAQDGVYEPPTGPSRINGDLIHRMTMDRVAVLPSPSSPQLAPLALDLVLGMENTLQMVMQQQDMVWKWPFWNEGNLVQSLLNGYRTLLALFGHVIEVLATPSVVGPAGLAAQPASWLPCGNSLVEGWCTSLIERVCDLLYIATPASKAFPFILKIMLSRGLQDSYRLLLRGQRQAPPSMSPEAERLLACLTLVLTAMVPQELCLAFAGGVKVRGLDKTLEKEGRAMRIALSKLQPEQVWTWQALAAGTPAEVTLQGSLPALAALFGVQSLVRPIPQGWRPQRLTLAMGDWQES